MITRTQDCGDGVQVMPGIQGTGKRVLHSENYRVGE